jgi:hypothetical protein
MGEPTTLAKDLWARDQGRILAVPSVHVGYSDAETEKIKGRRGHVGEHVDLDQGPEWSQTAQVVWKKAPGQIKCAPTWNEVWWVDPF